MALIFWISDRSWGSGDWERAIGARRRKKSVAIRMDFICGSLSVERCEAALYKGWAVSEDGKRF